MLAMLVMAVLVELSMVQRLGLLQASELHILKAPGSWRAVDAVGPGTSRKRWALLRHMRGGTVDTMPHDSERMQALARLPVV